MDTQLLNLKHSNRFFFVHSLHFTFFSPIYVRLFAICIMSQMQECVGVGSPLYMFHFNLFGMVAAVPVTDAKCMHDTLTHSLSLACNTLYQQICTTNRLRKNTKKKFYNAHADLSEPPT